MNAVLKYGAAVVLGATAITTGLVAKWEPGPSDAMLKAHRDPVGNIEICYGHTKGVELGDVATREQCDAWRAQDIRIAQDVVSKCIDYPLTANQLGALGDAVFNLGPKVVCGSTLQRKANAGDMRGACAELTDAMNNDGQRRGWSFAAGKFVRGLFLRRIDERDVCWPDFGNVESGAAWAS